MTRQSNFERRLRMLIGTGQFARTERLIRLVAEKIGHRTVTAALDRPADRCRIEGWDTIGFRMEEAKQFLHGDNKGREWRAMILGLRNDTAVRDLSVETRFALSDEARPSHPLSSRHDAFQQKRFRRLMQSQASLPEADLVTMDVQPLRLLGLDDLYVFQREWLRKDWSERREGLLDLAAAAILLRFHQAAERHALSDGLPRAIPIYATVRPVSRPMESNDFNFGEVATRRLIPVVGDFRSRTAELVAEVERAQAKEFAFNTRQLVTAIRDADAVLSLWPETHNPANRQQFRDMIRLDREMTRDAMQRMYGLFEAELDGEALVERVIRARHGRVLPELAESLPFQECTEVHQFRLNYALIFGGPRVEAYLEGATGRPSILDDPA